MEQLFIYTAIKLQSRNEFYLHNMTKQEKKKG